LIIFSNYFSNKQSKFKCSCAESSILSHSQLRGCKTLATRQPTFLTHFLRYRCSKSSLLCLKKEDITKKTLDPNKLTQKNSAIADLSVQQLQDFGFYGKTTAKEALELMKADRKDLNDSKIFIEYCEKVKSDIVAKALEEGDDKQIY